MSECIHGRLKRQCNECDLQKENQELKARIASLEQAISDGYDSDKDAAQVLDYLVDVLNETPQQSLAAIKVDAAKKAFWAGFEISRSFPDDHKIEWFWHEWAKVNYPKEYAQQLRQKE